MKDKPKTGAKNRPISLAPLDFTQAVDGLLGVTPAKKKPEPQPPAKKPRGKK